VGQYDVGGKRRYVYRSPLDIMPPRRHSGTEGM
jgi:hypothetical protein